MFNDKYGLTRAVLEGRKTMTRRIIPDNLLRLANEYVQKVHGTGHDFLDCLLEHAHYKAGEIVAVAQSYKDLGHPDFLMGDRAGWNNKMFVSALMCYHQIRITHIRIERLQDISDKDCEREGLEWINRSPGIYKRWTFKGVSCDYETRREAFAALIDKVSGNGTWKRNPWVFVYEFVLVK